MTLLTVDYSKVTFLLLTEEYKSSGVRTRHVWVLLSLSFILVTLGKLPSVKWAGTLAEITDG